MNSNIPSVIVVALAIVCGCSGTSTSGPNTFPGQDGGGDVASPGSDAGPRLTGERVVPGPRPTCPDKVKVGDPCTDDGLQCSYGDSKTWRCRVVFTCENATWKVDKPGCDTAEQACSPMPKHQSPCEPNADATAKRCATLDGYCECFICDRFSPEDPACITEGTKWQCFSPPQNLDCPLLPPNFGEGCSTPGTYCFYGVTCNEAGVGTLCRNGAWEPSSIFCEQ